MAIGTMLGGDRKYPSMISIEHTAATNRTIRGEDERPAKMRGMR
jgi:hypothetical protein